MLLGWSSRVIEFLGASDMLCFPTLYEGAPIIVQEAMAAGTVG
jgi:glycosyltransferase involved in cell wall biosynthesis